jgi:hypothetical protein
MAKKLELKRDKLQHQKAMESAQRKETIPTTFAFGRENYIVLIAGIVVLIIGYCLMIGGGAENRDTFNPEIFNSQRITVAPITLLIGFGVVLYGIMMKPKKVE